MQETLQLISSFMQLPGIKPAVILAVAVLVALAARLVFNRFILRLVAKTNTGVDDSILTVLRTPVVQTVILVGIALAVASLDPLERTMFITGALLETVAVFIWGRAAMKVGMIVLSALSERIDSVTWIQPKTLPLLEIVLKVVVVAGSLYFALVAWQINVTSWLASAGIAGIAIGFAAKDTLANLFAGIFIVADAPYKIGDFVILDNGLRGKVVDIGIRSSRILTRDDIEVTVPNAVIAASKIINETGGPHQKMRARVKVSVAYGSDIDQVCEVLLQCTEGVAHVVPDPEPRVRFRRFGDSGLEFELLVWIEEPVYRGRVLHAMNTRVYKAFNQAGIEIPYPKHDVYIKEHPGHATSSQDE
jgi:small-conductance mechanosensitive channel